MQVRNEATVIDQSYHEIKSDLHVFNAELESKVQIYDHVARILRQAGGKRASEFKKNPSFFPRSGKKKLREIYRSNSI